MSKHRGNGEGCISKRKDGTWVAVVTIGRDPITGKLNRKFVYRKTRKEAQEALMELLTAKQKGLRIDHTRQTLADFLTSWLKDSVKGSTALKTHESYTCIVNRHIIPAIGSIRLTKLQPQHLQRLYREKQDTGLTRTVQLIHAVLHRALGQAMKFGFIPRNVADAVDRPKVARKEMKVLTETEVTHFLKTAQDDPLYALYILAITCGLRQGELLALKWSDFNKETATLQIQRQLQWNKGKAYFKEPKSAKSRRTLSLPTIAVEALRKHKAQQAEQRLAMGAFWQDQDLIFTSKIGTPINQSNFMKKSFYPLREKAEVQKIRFHDLRHTSATLLLKQGVHPKVVQEMLGHSQISLTLDTYSHVLPSMHQEAAAKMDAIISSNV